MLILETTAQFRRDYKLMKKRGCMAVRLRRRIVTTRLPEITPAFANVISNPTGFLFIRSSVTDLYLSHRAMFRIFCKCPVP